LGARAACGSYSLNDAMFPFENLRGLHVFLLFQQLCFHFRIDWRTAQWLACTLGLHLHTSDLEAGVADLRFVKTIARISDTPRFYATNIFYGSMGLTYLAVIIQSLFYIRLQ
jgi:hypothetical protein